MAILIFFGVVFLMFKIFILIIGLFFLGCEQKIQQTQKPIVATSTFALYDVTSHIAQDSVDVIHILPFGVDPHSFEPTPKLMAKLEKAKLVIFSGAGLEPWAEKFQQNLKTLDMSHFVKLQKAMHHHHKEHTHHHSGYDPHYWLDIENMKKVAKVITQKLSELFPENKVFYESNMKDYLSRLEDLEAQFNKELNSCKKNTIIVSHNAFSYLAHKYGFEVESLTGLAPEAQPNAKDMQQLFKTIKQKNLNVVFFEHFVNNKTMKTIAKDSGVKLDVLQPLGNITANEHKKGLGYYEIMQDNLNKIAKALECQE